MKNVIILMIWLFGLYNSALATGSPTYLYFMKKTNTACKWYLVEAPSYSKPIEINTTSDCNTHVLFSKLEPKMIFIDNQALHELHISSELKKRKLASIPSFVQTTDTRFRFGTNSKNEFIFRNVIAVKSPKLFIENKKNFISHKQFKVSIPSLDEGYAIGPDYQQILVELYTFKKDKWILTDVKAGEDAHPEDIFNKYNQHTVFNDEFESNVYNHLRYNKLEKWHCQECQTIEDKAKLAEFSKIIELPKNTDKFNYAVRYLPLTQDGSKSLLFKEIYSNLESEMQTSDSSGPFFYCKAKSSCTKLKLTKSGFSTHMNSLGHLLLGDYNKFSNPSVLIPQDKMDIKEFKNALNTTWLKQDYLK